MANADGRNTSTQPKILVKVSIDPAELTRLRGIEDAARTERRFTPELQDRMKELIITLEIMTNDHQSLRAAYFSYPGKPSDGDSPNIRTSREVIARASAALSGDK